VLFFVNISASETLATGSTPSDSEMRIRRQRGDLAWISRLLGRAVRHAEGLIRDSLAKGHHIGPLEDPALTSVVGPRRFRLQG